MIVGIHALCYLLRCQKLLAGYDCKHFWRQHQLPLSSSGALTFFFGGEENASFLHIVGIDVRAYSRASFGGVACCCFSPLPIKTSEQNDPPKMKRSESLYRSQEGGGQPSEI